MFRLAKGQLKKILQNLSISYTNSFLGFIVFLLLARLLGADDYSMVAIGIAVGGFVTPLLDLGSAKTFVRDAVAMKNSTDIVRLAQTSFNMRLTVAFILFFIVFGASCIYIDNVIGIVSITLLSIWAGLLGLYPTSWFDYFHKTLHQNMCVMIERVLVIFLIGVLLSLKIEIQLLILVSVMLIIIRGLSILYQVKWWWKKYANIFFTYKLSFPRSNSPGTNVYFTLALLSNAFLVYGNQLVLAHTGDAIALTTFSLAFQLVCLIFLFQSQAIRILNRDISNICQSGSRNTLIRHLIFHLIFLVFVSGVLALGIFFIAKYIPGIIGDIRFVGLIEFVPMLCVWVIIAGAGQVITQYLLEVNQEFFHLITSIAIGVSAIFLSLVFVPKYGAISIPIIMVSVQSVASGIRVMRLIYISGSIDRREV